MTAATPNEPAATVARRASLDDHLVIVARFADSPRAYFACAYLEGHGIAVELGDKHTIAMYGGLLSNALGGIKLLVRASDAARAHELLAAAHAQRTHDTDDSSPAAATVANDTPVGKATAAVREGEPGRDPGATCPSCGSDFIAPVPGSRMPRAMRVLPILLLVYLLGPFLALVGAVVLVRWPHGSARDCVDCGHRW